jgi:outer membrane protein
VLAAGAGKPGPTTVQAKASSSWAPVFNLGATVAITDRIGLLASVTYIPLKTTSSLIVKAADGTELAVTKGELKADPIITYLALTYKF